MFKIATCALNIRARSTFYAKCHITDSSNALLVARTTMKCQSCYPDRWRGSIPATTHNRRMIMPDPIESAPLATPNMHPLSAVVTQADTGRRHVATSSSSWLASASDWPVAVLAWMMALMPALGVPSELMLQDTLKSTVAAFGVLIAALIFFWQQRHRTEPLL